MSTCCDPTCGQSINVKSAQHMHQNRGRPAPKPRATHPNSAGPQLPQFLSRMPPIQTLRGPPAHPSKLHAGPQLLSRVPPIQTVRAPSSRAACQPSKTTACHPSCHPSKLRGPPAPKPSATQPNSAGLQLPSRVPPNPPGAFLFLRRGPQQFLFGE